MSIEKRLEKKLKAEIDKRGGDCIKFVPTFCKGFTDRIVIMPRGKIYFLEVKDEGLEPSKAQQSRIRRLTGLSHDAGYINSDKSLNQFLNKIDLDQIL